MTIPHKPFGELSDAEKGALLLAHHEGKRIECHVYKDGAWTTVDGGPLWVNTTTYRIAPEPKVPDSINWEHVAPEYNFMARDEYSDYGFLYHGKPRLRHCDWGNDTDHKVWNAGLFASYRRGTVEWQDSLVIRPGYEGT